MKTLEQTLDKVTDIMLSDFYAGCDDFRPSGLHIVAFVYDQDINTLRETVDELFRFKLKTLPDPINS